MGLSCKTSALKNFNWDAYKNRHPYKSRLRLINLPTLQVVERGLELYF